jgi:hypothetical protein
MDSMRDQCQGVDLETLDELARKATKDPLFKIVDWSCAKIKEPGHPVTAGVYRFCGTGITGAKQQHWSMILKIVQWQDLTNQFGQDIAAIPEHGAYWKREALVFQSNIIDDRADGLVPVRCYDVVEKGSDTIWLWLEDLEDAAGFGWNLDRHVLAARHFGQFNGAHIERRIDFLPWIHGNRSFLRKWVDAMYRPETSLNKPDVIQHPIIQKAFPQSVINRWMRALSNRDKILNKLDGLTQTLSHQDTDKRNLFSRRSDDGLEQTIVIDWAFLGLAAVGEDLGNQVFGNLSFLCVDCSAAREYQESAFSAYIGGLHEAGWESSIDDVYFAFMANALHYLAFACGGVTGFAAKSRLPLGVDSWAKQNGCTVQEAFFHWGKALMTILEAAEEAWKLVK